MVAAAVRERAAAAGRSPLVRSSGGMLVGHGGRAVLQALTFLLLARALRADGFGAASAVMAVGALVGPFASLGAVHLLIRAAVRTPEQVARSYAGAVVVTAAGGVLATALAAAAAAWYLPGVPLAVAAGVLAADLVGALLVEVAAGVQNARGRSLAAAGCYLALHGARLVAVVALLAAPAAFTLRTWAPVWAAASVLAAAGVLLAVRRAVGPARPAVREHLAQWRDGLHFSVGLASQALYNDLDKAMLARLGSLGAAGAYTAAYRVVDVALTPLRAVLAAAYPRFFAAGAEGLPAAVALVRRLAAPTVGWCALASVALLAGADLVPLLLGPSYAPAVGALRGLALLPLLKVAHYLAADALTGAGHQRVRSGWQLGVAVGNAGLNLWLIPAHGLAGAVVASLVCDGALAAGLWAVVLRRLRAARA